MLEFELLATKPGFNLTIPKLALAEHTGIFGQSGSGKTTLLRLLAGLERGELNAVSFAGNTWANNSQFVAPHLRPLALQGQASALFPHLNVRDNLALVGRVTGTELNAICQGLELEDLRDKAVGELSGGQARRVALARALAVGPELLLLDEPFTGLDVKRKHSVITFLKAWLQQRETQLLLVSHSPEDLIMLCNESLVLEAGQLLDHGPTYQVLNRQLSEQHQAIVMRLDSLQAAEHQGWVWAYLGEHKLLVEGELSEASALPHLLSFNPNQVVISLGAVQCSAQNQLPARVVKLSKQQSKVLVHIALHDLSFTVPISPQAQANLNLQADQQVTLLIKAAQLHLS